jgi:hypothetical protein
MYTADVDATIIKTANNDHWGDHRARWGKKMRKKEEGWALL